MTDPTPRLALPLLEPGQAQKEMFHNEALIRLDIAVQGAAAGPLDTPPAAPAPGQCWLVGAAPTGDWVGHGNEVAGWTDAGWRFLAPREGMRLWLGTPVGFALFVEGEWRIGGTYGKLFVEGQQVVGAQGSPIPEPAGGTVVDGEARDAIVAVLEALRSHGLIESD
ncbi:MAG TPA: DUF2793 domain-containing protein [Sphingomonas sp.]|nr:DUF2793 domain-containing protein [Sphingomonas sp.]